MKPSEMSDAQLEILVNDLAAEYEINHQLHDQPDLLEKAQMLREVGRRLLK